MMELIFTTLVRDELVEAKRYYNRQQQGLGDQFNMRLSLHHVAYLNILSHGNLKMIRCDVSYLIGFLTKCFMLSGSRKLSSLLLRISIVRRITGLTEFSNCQVARRTQ